jgi:hypothetical protein
MLPVLAFQPLSPTEPQKAEFWKPPPDPVSSLLMLLLARTPALSRCFPNTAE